ncbi:MAG: hypothetical protein KAT65_26055, partial [Methanophagales archaeon]|nr:hypothetical protein [Methanophagales archaeon]
FHVLDVGNAREATRELLVAGIRVRDCCSFGLPSHTRFSISTDDENELLLQFLSKYFNRVSRSVNIIDSCSSH